MPRTGEQQLLLAIELTLLGILAALVGAPVVGVILGFAGLTLTLSLFARRPPT